jgi:hypothetical protein
MRAFRACLGLTIIAMGATSVSAQQLQLADPLAPLVESAPGPSDNAKVVMDWVLASRDNGSLPYLVIDKTAAEVFVFDSVGQQIGQTPALLGSAKGDTSAPGVGERELRHIPPQDRTTPAGRFIAKFGHASGNQKVLWVDWTTAVSLHPVVTANRSEHRLQRLASATPEDNRITYGCINVPAAFYKDVVAPLLAGTAAVVYILPEERSLNEVFWASATAQQAASAQ